MGRLFWKFFLSILLAQLAAASGVGAVFWVRDQERIKASAAAINERAIDTRPSAETTLNAVAATLKYGGAAALHELVEQSSRQSIIVIDDQGRELLGRSIPPELKAKAETMLHDDPARSAVRRLTAPDGAQYLVFVRSMERHGAGAPGGHRMAMMRELGMEGPPPGPSPSGPPGSRKPPEHELRLWIPLLAATVASLLFAALLAWYFSRPIRALRDAFDAAAGGDLAPRFAIKTGVRGDELNDLGRDFDRMTAQLRVLMDGQRRLLHDVSHEMRSPLARLQAAIGLAHQQPDKLAASLERIERESVRMDKLVGELLTLSRLEASPALPVREPIALMELLEEIAGDASFEAEHAGRRIALSGLAVVTVQGAPDLLWRAIENVVRNAIKHSPAGGTVDIDVSADAVEARVAVLDRGPGVAAADIGAIFEPFYRANATSNNVDGHGLGLAIALRVVEAHGGSIAAANREGGGLSVLISLPVSS